MQAPHNQEKGVSVVKLSELTKLSAGYPPRVVMPELLDYLKEIDPHPFVEKIEIYEVVSITPPKSESACWCDHRGGTLSITFERDGQSQTADVLPAPPRRTGQSIIGPLDEQLRDFAKRRGLVYRGRDRTSRERTGEVSVRMIEQLEAAILWLNGEVARLKLGMDELRTQLEALERHDNGRVAEVDETELVLEPSDQLQLTILGIYPKISSKVLAIYWARWEARPWGRILLTMTIGHFLERLDQEKPDQRLQLSNPRKALIGRIRNVLQSYVVGQDPKIPLEHYGRVVTALVDGLEERGLVSRPTWELDLDQLPNFIATLLPVRDED